MNANTNICYKALALDNVINPMVGLKVLMHVFLDVVHAMAHSGYLLNNSLCEMSRPVLLSDWMSAIQSLLRYFSLPRETVRRRTK